MVLTSYEESDDEGEVETISTINQTYIVSDFKSNEEAMEKFFAEDIDDEVEANPRTTVNTRVIQVTKKLQPYTIIVITKLSRKQLKKKVQNKI